MTDVTLSWNEVVYIEDIFPILKRWRHLKRLKFQPLLRSKTSVPPLDVISDFIMETKHLSYLHINYCSDSAKLKILRDKVNELFSPVRPNFKFNILLIRS
jgi:hypothetical protein